MPCRALQLSAMGLAGLFAGSISNPSYAATLSDGTWIVEEACGENKAAKDAEARKPFSWEIVIEKKGDRITGSKHFVNPKTNAVVDLSYQGSISGSKMRIEGTGKRSGLDRPWLYSYEGQISA